ncbi:MAG TPA: hypothetical protein PKL67_08375 [Anaerolineae bacterium]|nr:hypothetical protein [Anaerolineae bacterium]
MAAPTFNDGQVLSAALHLNALQRNVQELHDEMLGVQMPVTGLADMDRVWTGAIRHKVDTLEYKVKVTTARQHLTLAVNGGTVATLSGVGVKTGTVNLASHGIALDAFYLVTVTADYDYFEVHLIRERKAASYPTLASFANGTTPTAAQWQALSTHADTVRATIGGPSAVGSWDARSNVPVSEYIWAGTMTHRSRYLAFGFYMSAPYNPADDGGPPYIDGFIGVNGTGVVRRRNGRHESSPSASYDFDQTPDREKLWTGVVDLETYPAPGGAGLAVGADYLLTFGAYDSTTYDLFPLGQLQYLYETPNPAGATLAGWTAWETWTQGDYVYGNSNPAPANRKITTIRSNLALLAAAAPTYFNPASRLVSAYNLFGCRKRRFLHYRSSGATTITWRARGQEQQSGLPLAVDRWLALDLDSLDGLYQGTAYRLEGVNYAIEDDVP